MKHCRSARGPVIVAAMIVASAARAGVWTANPVLGISADYASNPTLADVPGQQDKNAALLIDSPTTYVADPYKFSILPSFRFGGAQGYSSLDSDYEHLTTRGEFDGDRTVLSGSLGVARDSSLYHDSTSTGISNGTTGVRRDSITADINWDRSLTELVNFDADLNELHTRYDQTIGAALLTDYKYASLAPSVTWKTSDLAKWNFAMTGGLYDSLDGTTQSKSLNAQLGYSARLNELWSLSLSGGYSRANNKLSQTEFVALGGQIFGVPVNQESSQNGTVFSFNLTRQGTLLNTTLALSRQLTPGGFAYLSRQETYELTGSYQFSARWTFSGDLRWVDYQIPTFGAGAASTLSTGYYSLSTAWQWTEHLTLTIGASRVLQRLPSPSPGISSNSISLSLSRRFDPVVF